MASIPAPHAPKEIFDDLDKRSKLFSTIALFGFLMIICVLVVLYADELNRTRLMRLVLLCWLLLAAGVLRLAFNLRDWFKAFRHEPALRLDDRGIWCREWSSLGTIEWADIRSLYMDAGTSVKQTLGTIVVSLRNEEKYLRRLGWSDFLSLAVSRFWDMYFGAGSTKDRLVLPLTLLSIEQAKAEIDPVLAAHDLPPLAPRSAG
jgi:hypothetical protein